MGYFDVTKQEDKIFIYLDLGNCDDTDTAIKGILTTLNNIPGIEKVILNEDSEFDF